MSDGGEVRWEELKPVLRALNDRLDHIEQYLVASAQRNGPAYSLFAGAGGAPPPAANVVQLARAGKTLDAIKAYREQSGLDLQQARAVVLAI